MALHSEIDAYRGYFGVGVEVHGMNILFIPIVPPNGPCPKCGRQATLTLIEFDSRTVEVKCCFCGTFTTTKPRHGDGL
jgi:hypothetical protein